MDSHPPESTWLTESHRVSGGSHFFIWTCAWHHWVSHVFLRTMIPNEAEALIRVKVKMSYNIK